MRFIELMTTNNRKMIIKLILNINSTIHIIHAIADIIYETIVVGRWEWSPDTTLTYDWWREEAIRITEKLDRS